MDFINQVHVPEKGMKITSKQVGNIALIQNAVPKLLEKRKPFKQSILSRLFNKQLLQQRDK